MRSQTSCVFLLVVAFLFGVVDPAAAQQPAAASPPAKNIPLAVLLEYAVPTLGHGYAGNWARGVPAALATGAGIAVLGVGMGPCLDEECTAVIAGAVIAGAGRLWGLISAAQTARAKNEQRQSGIQPLAWVSRGILGFGITVTTL